MKKLRNLMFVFLLLMAVICLTLGLLFKHYTSSVGESSETVTVELNNGSQIGDSLEKAGLIRSATFYKIYLKLFNIDSKQFKDGIYQLNKEMDLKEIIEKLKIGSNYNPDEISITFKEGINMRELAKVIQANTSNTYESNNNNNLNNENHYYNIGENKFNYKEYKKNNNNQYKQRKNNNYIQKQNNIKVGVGKTVNLSLNKINELNIRNGSLERTNMSLNKKLLDKERLISKLVRTINALKNNTNNENENKLNFLINEFNDSKKILAELKTKNDLILKMGSKINVIEQEINKLKRTQTGEDKFNTEKKIQNDNSTDRIEFIDTKKEKSSLLEYNISNNKRS